MDIDRKKDMDHGIARNKESNRGKDSIMDKDRNMDINRIMVKDKGKERDSNQCGDSVRNTGRTRLDRSNNM